MFCDKCGKEVPEGSTFCTECGAKVEIPPGATAPAAAAPAAPPAEAPPPPPPGVTVSPPAPEPEAAAPVMPAAPAEAGGPPPGPPPAPAMGAMPPKKKRTGLKVGIAVVAAIVVLAVVVVVLILVMPNGNSKARDLINKAAKPMADVTSKGTTLGTDLNTMLTDLTPTSDQAQFAKAADKVTAEIKQIDAELNQAKGYLEQVSGTSANQDYKTYAGYALDIAKTDLALTAAITAFLDYASQALTQNAAGNPVSSEEFSTKGSAFVTKVNQLDAQATKLKDKALKFKTDHKL